MPPSLLELEDESESEEEPDEDEEPDDDDPDAEDEPPEPEPDPGLLFLSSSSSDEDESPPQKRDALASACGWEGGRVDHVQRANRARRRVAGRAPCWAGSRPGGGARETG